MLIRLNTDRHIDASAQLAGQVESAVETALQRYSDRVTRVEVHVSDQNGARGGGRDKQCSMEARLAGLQPIAVDHLAPTLDRAIDGAADKLGRAIERATARAGKAPPDPVVDN